MGQAPLRSEEVLGGRVHQVGIVVVEATVGFAAVGEESVAQRDFQARVDEENATGKRIIDIAEEIVTPKKSKTIGQWLDGVWRSDFFKGSYLGPNAAEGKTAPAPGKVVGTKDGKNVYELPGGKWQIGE